MKRGCLVTLCCHVKHIDLFLCRGVYVSSNLNQLLNHVEIAVEGSIQESISPNITLIIHIDPMLQSVPKLVDGLPTLLVQYSHGVIRVFTLHICHLVS